MTNTKERPAHRVDRRIARSVRIGLGASVLGAGISCFGAGVAHADDGLGWMPTTDPSVGPTALAAGWGSIPDTWSTTGAGMTDLAAPAETGVQPTTIVGLSSVAPVAGETWTPGYDTTQSGSLSGSDAITGHGTGPLAVDGGYQPAVTGVDGVAQAPTLDVTATPAPLESTAAAPLEAAPTSLIESAATVQLDTTQAVPDTTVHSVSKRDTDTTSTPAPTPSFEDLDDAVTLWAHPVVEDPKYPVQSAEDVTRDHASTGRGFLYRGDGRAPEQVFQDGFRAQGTSGDLASHLSFRLDDQTHRPVSGYVSTSVDPDAAARYTRGNGRVYVVAPQGETGYFIPSVFPSSSNGSAIANNAEFAVNNGISPDHVSGYIDLGNGGRFVPNPGYASNLPQYEAPGESFCDGVVSVLCGVSLNRQLPNGTVTDLPDAGPAYTVVSQQPRPAGTSSTTAPSSGERFPQLEYYADSFNRAPDVPQQRTWWDFVFGDKGPHGGEH